MAILIKKMGLVFATASALTVLPTVLAKPAAATLISTTTNIVTNGSFESTKLNNGGWEISNSIEGWSLSNGSLGSGIEVQNHADGDPFDGNNLVELDSDGNTGIFQDLATKVGQKYKLEFAFSSRAGVAENLLNVKWGSKLVASLQANGSALGNTDWKTFSYDLVAKSNITRLSFDNFGSYSDSYGTYIDKVSVTGVTAVPEPASVMGLMAFGAFGATGLRKRKQQKVTIQA